MIHSCIALNSKVFEFFLERLETYDGADESVFSRNSRDILFTSNISSKTLYH